MLPFIQRAYGLLITVGNYFQHLLLLLLRLYWGWRFHLTGTAKLNDIESFTKTFRDDFHVPFPKISVYFAGSIECFGGLMLMAGLASRLISIPLAFTMIVAYATAEVATLHFTPKTDDEVILGPFVDAAPYIFLMVALIVFAFGPGVFSLDWLIGRKFKPGAKCP